MQALPAPETMNLYMLLRQTGMCFCPITIGTPSLGTGMFATRGEAEMARTVEYLRDTTTGSVLHVFELTIPNPAFK